MSSDATEPTAAAAPPPGEAGSEPSAPAAVAAPASLETEVGKPPPVETEVGKPPGGTSLRDLDRAIGELGDQARAFARMPARDKAALLAATIPRIVAAAPAWVRAACEAKGIDAATAAAGEEWLAGPYATVSNARLLVEALGEIVDFGRPLLPRGAIRTRGDGRVTVRLVPQPGPEGMTQRGHALDVWMLPGTTRDDVTARQASLHRQSDPEGGVSLVLGAGNVTSIPPMDALHRLFVEGRVVLLKLHPVTDWLAPHLEAALAPLIERGVLRIVRGGADQGAYLARHAGIADVHVTGSHATYESLVWGDPGPEREARRAAGTPVRAKRVTAELGNVTPVVVVPWLYDKRELWYQARSVASQVTNNASFNCNAAKVLVLPRGWSQRDVFLGLVRDALRRVPTRRAWYPGAAERHAQLCSHRDRGPGSRAGRVETIGNGDDGRLPWTLVHEPDPTDRDEPLWRVEPFCSLLTVVSVGSDDPVEFLDEATRFVNERLWGTLACSLVVHPLLHEEPDFSAAHDRALASLRYGCIAINTWPGVAYALPIAPWGAHGAATPADAPSGIGFVHGAAMLEGVEKVVLAAPLTQFPRPPYFYDHRRADVLGERLVAFAASPSWSGALGLLPPAMLG